MFDRFRRRVANGKAGAYFPGLDQFEATRLRFRTHQDALDFADHIVQEAIGCRPFITLDEWSRTIAKVILVFVPRSGSGVRRIRC